MDQRNTEKSPTEFLREQGMPEKVITLFEELAKLQEDIENKFYGPVPEAASHAQATALTLVVAKTKLGVTGDSLVEWLEQEIQRLKELSEE